MLRNLVLTRNDSVLMKGITWSRDSHGLFDYESRHLTKNTMKTSFASQIRRKSNEIELIPLESASLRINLMTDPEVKPLLNIVNDQGK